MFFFNSKKEAKVAILGLDGAGKTSILYRLILNEDVTSLTTKKDGFVGLRCGFEPLNNIIPGLNLQIYDLAGCKNARPLWLNYISRKDHKNNSCNISWIPSNHDICSPSKVWTELSGWWTLTTEIVTRKAMMSWWIYCNLIPSAVNFQFYFLQTNKIESMLYIRRMLRGF